MAKITDIFGSFASEEEKDKFLESQFTVITQLNKQIEQLKSEKKNLEQQLKLSTAPVITSEQQDEPDEIRICKEQLRLLKDVSADRELTAEESRKVDTYAKILFQNKDSLKKSNTAVDKLTTKELLKIVSDDDATKIN